MAEKKAKKKLPRIEARKYASTAGAYGVSSGETFVWAFVSPPAEGRRQASNTIRCREYVNRAVWSFNNEQSSTQYKWGHDANIDMTKLRILVLSDPENTDDFKRRLFAAKGVLNLYERIAGWQQSTISTVKHPNYDKAWLITGPGEWMSQPQLLSAATFILRFCTHYGPFNYESIDTLEAEFKELLDSGRSKSKYDCDSDLSQNLGKYWNRMFILLKYAKEIFEGLGLKDAWCPPKSSCFSSYSGIRTFWEGTGDNTINYSPKVAKARQRFKELCKKHLPRKNKLLKRRSV